MYSDNLLNLKKDFMQYVPTKIVNYSEALQNLYMDDSISCDGSYILKLPNGENKYIDIIDEIKNYMQKDTTGLEYILSYNTDQTRTTINLLPIVQSG